MSPSSSLAVQASALEATADWLVVLDDLEARLGAAGAPEVETWTVPLGLGPVPAELVERARRLLEAQHSAITRLQAQLEEVSRHLAAVRAVPAAREDRSVYLDIDA